ncbi:MAG: tautomerase family protein [Acidobacteria bacterium]|nr:MAG: tautomerase family protein [Acidobacteriota bacterium]
MPFVRLTLAQGRSTEDRRAMAESVQQALVETAGVPADDFFCAVHEVPPEDFRFDPTYLGIQRTKELVVVQIVLNAGRTVEVKRALYARLAEKLGQRPGLRHEDVLINLVEVPRENWSFGNGVMSYSPAP